MAEERVIILVSNSLKRDSVMKTLLFKLKHQNECAPEIIITQPSLNRIEIRHNTGSVMVLIKSILVLVIPIIVNTDSINCMTGKVTINSQDVISELKEAIKKLEALNGPVILKRGSNATAEELDSKLSGLYDKY